MKKSFFKATILAILFVVGVMLSGCDTSNKCSNNGDCYSDSQGGTNCGSSGCSVYQTMNSGNPGSYSSDSCNCK